MISFRPVQTGDAPFLHRLMNEPSLLRILRELPTPLSLWEEAIPFWQSDPDEEDHIILCSGEPAGWLGVNGLASETTYIKMLVLLPEYQHRSIGPAVLQQILRELKERGCSLTALYTDEDNSAARRCYEKCGFAVTEHLVEQMTDGSTPARVRMEIRL